MTDDTGRTQNLARSMHWIDGCVLALVTISALIAVVGHSVVPLGAVGAAALWGVSVTIAMAQNAIYSEMAAMFPDRSGGIPMYADAGWRRYTPLIGPITTMGYWFAWATVPALFGLAVGDLLTQALGLRPDAVVSVGPLHLTIPRLIAAGLVSLLWLLNVLGARPSIAVSYVLAVSLMVPTVLLISFPFVTQQEVSLGTASLGHEPLGWRHVFAWLYLMGWSSYATEIGAAFAPEYRDTARDTAKVLLVSAGLALVVFVLLPLSVGRLVAPEEAAAAPGAMPAVALEVILGDGSLLILLFLVAGLVLGMNSAMLDSSRALYGAALAGTTVAFPGVVSPRGVPVRALTISLGLALVLIAFVDSIIAILAIGNLAYFLTHVFALSAFWLLRRDAPERERPIRLPAFAVPIAVALAVLNAAFVAVGAVSFELTGYGGPREIVLAVIVPVVALALYAMRRWRASRDRER